MDHNTGMDQGEARRAASPRDQHAVNHPHAQDQSIQHFAQKSFLAYDWTQRFQDRQQDLYLPLPEQEEGDTFGIGRDTSFDEGQINERAPVYPTYAPHFNPRLPSPPTHENQRGYVIPDVMRHAFLDSYNDLNVPSTSSGPIYPIAGDHMFANAPEVE